MWRGKGDACPYRMVGKVRGSRDGFTTHVNLITLHGSTNKYLTLNFLSQINLGFKAYKQAHGFIKEHGLFSYFLMPIAFNFVLFMFFSGIIWHYSGIAAIEIEDRLGISNSDFGSWNFLKTVVHFTIAILLKVVGLVIYMLIFRYLVLILMAPVLAMISERVEEIVSGKSFAFEWLQFLKDTLRGILIAIINSVKEIVYTILIFLLSFVPLVGFISPVLLFLLVCYYYGFSMMDYTLERRKMNIRQSENFIWKHKWLAIVLGMVFNVLVIFSTTFSVFPSIFISFFVKVVLLIPLIALSVAPIYGVVAGTLATLQLTEKKSEDLASIN